MAKHACPDCGASHDMDTAGRIARLEERVKELEAQRPCPHPHWTNTYYPTTYYPWISGGTTVTSPRIYPNTTTYQPNTSGPVTVYSTSNALT